MTLSPRRFFQVLLGLAATAAAAYAADTLRLHLRPPAEAYASVTIDHYLVYPLKNGRDEYDFTGSEERSCVRALFPHQDRPPCWYLQRHRQETQSFSR